MEKMLMEFIGRVMRTPELRKKFASCKNLKETYDKFKDELNGCSYETYKNFFKKAVATKSNLSVDELKNVSGGISLKTLLAPTALLAMFTAAPALANFVGEDDISVGMVAHAAHPKNAKSESEEESEYEYESESEDEDLPWVINATEEAKGFAEKARQAVFNGNIDSAYEFVNAAVRAIERAKQAAPTNNESAKKRLDDAERCVNSARVEVEAECQWDENVTQPLRLASWSSYGRDISEAPPAKIPRMDTVVPPAPTVVDSAAAVEDGVVPPAPTVVDSAAAVEDGAVPPAPAAVDSAAAVEDGAVPPAPAAVDSAAAVGGAEVVPSLSPTYFAGRDGIVIEKEAGSFKVVTIPPEYIAMTTTEGRLFRYTNGRKQDKPSSTCSYIDGLGYRLAVKKKGRPYVHIYASPCYTDNCSLRLIPFVDGDGKPYPLRLAETLLGHPLIVDANTVYIVLCDDGTCKCFWTTEPNLPLELSNEGGKWKLKAGTEVLVDNLDVEERVSRQRDAALPDVSGGNGIRQCLDGISDTNGFKILALPAATCGQGEARFVVGSECYKVPVGADARVTLSGLSYWRGKDDNTVQVYVNGRTKYHALASCWDNTTPGDGATTQAKPYAMSFSTTLENHVFSLTINTLYAIRCTSSERRDMPARVIVPKEDMSVRVIVPKEDMPVRAFVPQEDGLHVMLVGEGGVWKLKRCLDDSGQWEPNGDVLIDNVLTFSRGGRKLAK